MTGKRMATGQGTDRMADPRLRRRWVEQDPDPPLLPGQVLHRPWAVPTGADPNQRNGTGAGVKGQQSIVSNAVRLHE